MAEVTLCQFFGQRLQENAASTFCVLEHLVHLRSLSTLRLPCREEAQDTCLERLCGTEMPINHLSKVPDIWVKSLQMIPALAGK